MNVRNNRHLGSPAVIKTPTKREARTFIHSVNAYDTNLLPVDVAPRRKIGRQLFVPKNESKGVIPYLLGILTDV